MKVGILNMIYINVINYVRTNSLKIKYINYNIQSLKKHLHTMFYMNILHEFKFDITILKIKLHTSFYMNVCLTYYFDTSHVEFDTCDVLCTYKLFILKEVEGC